MVDRLDAVENMLGDDHIRLTRLERLSALSPIQRGGGPLASAR